MMIDAKACAERLREWDNIVLLCHRDPDGDTYGSAAALADMLLAMGKRVTIECPTEFPKALSFLHREYPEVDEENTVAIDVAQPNMLGDREKRKRRVDLCIDHHPTNPGYAALTFLCNYAAAGEAVFEVMREMGEPISPFAATALFAALSSDTGGFNFANTTAQTHRYAADLIELGADVDLVRKRLFESNSKGRVGLESEALSNIRYYQNGAIAVLAISLEQTKRHGVEEGELEGIASKPLMIEGVRVAITLKERDDGSVRISMRSDSDEVDVSAVCANFYGGGHVRAAGCRIFDTLENAEKKLIKACDEVFA